MMNPAYQLSNIHYSHGDSFNLFLPELDIPAQKIIALIGDNGSGKSTLLSLLGLINLPNKGHLTFFGEQLTLKPRYDLRKKIGFLTQKPYLFRGTVIDNLSLVLKIHHIPQNQHLEKINLILAQLEITPLSTQQANTLSGGELQKVAFARALIIQPKILLMDEPFSYLDATSTQLLEKFIVAYVKKKKITLIFSTHNRLQSLIIADKIISLVKGRQL